MQCHGGQLILLIVASSAACGGCVESGRAVDDVRLTAGRPIEPDVPIPQGFRLIERAGEDRFTGTQRLYLRHMYCGNAGKRAVRGFYREHMPLSRWTLVSDGDIKGHLQLRFEKGAESCTIAIMDRSGLRSGTCIQVVIVREDREVPPTARKSP
jgi:hypothetical protein